MSLPEGPRPVFLVGFMGSGKSRVGAELARRLGWDFRDTDRMVQERERADVAAIFHRRGEAHFRAVEWQEVRTAGEKGAVVVACGGGVFQSATQRRWLAAHGRTVWLDVPLGLARERLRAARSGPETRPLWPEDDPLGLRLLFEKRRAAYALAECRIDGRGDPSEVAHLICCALGLGVAQDSC